MQGRALSTDCKKQSPSRSLRSGWPWCKGWPDAWLYPHTACAHKERGPCQSAGGCCCGRSPHRPQGKAKVLEVWFYQGCRSPTSSAPHLSWLQGCPKSGGSSSPPQRPCPNPPRPRWHGASILLFLHDVDPPCSEWERSHRWPMSAARSGKHFWRHLPSLCPQSAAAASLLPAKWLHHVPAVSGPCSRFEVQQSGNSQLSSGEGGQRATAVLLQGSNQAGSKSSLPVWETANRSRFGHTPSHCHCPLSGRSLPGSLGLGPIPSWSSSCITHREGWWCCSLSKMVVHQQACDEEDSWKVIEVCEGSSKVT